MQVITVCSLCLNPCLLPLHFLSLNLCSWVFLQKFLLWKSSKYYKFWDYGCILSYPTWNAHAPYCNKGPHLLYGILPRYVLNGKTFEEKLLDAKLCFDFLYSFCLKHFWFLEHWVRCENNVLWCSFKVHMFLSIFEWHFHFFDRFSKNIQKHNFIKFCPFENRGVPWRQSDRWTDIPKLIFAFPSFDELA